MDRAAGEPEVFHEWASLARLAVPTQSGQHRPINRRTPRLVPLPIPCGGSIRVFAWALLGSTINADSGWGPGCRSICLHICLHMPSYAYKQDGKAVRVGEFWGTRESSWMWKLCCASHSEYKKMWSIFFSSHQQIITESHSFKESVLCKPG